MLNNYKSTDGMKELHEGPLRGHFATKMTQRKKLDISGQLCTRCARLL
jgi:hypothetical protein